MTAAPLRIAVAAGYMPFFDEIMPPGYRADRDAYGRAAATVLDGMGEVTYLGLMHDEASGREAGARLAALRPHAVLLAPTMATPADYLWNVVEPAADVPVIVWAAHETDRIDPDYDMADLCRHSQNVGALMVGNMLSRHGRPFRLIAGPMDDADVRDEVREAIGAAAVAGRLRRARIGRLGKPLDAYSNVDVDEGALRNAIGAEIVDITLAEWEEAVEAVDREAIDDILARTQAFAKLDPQERPNDVVAAARIAAALEALCARHRLDAGAINCRGAFGVANPKIAALACLATTHLTSNGVPFACTGDLVTAIAMLAGRTLGGAALYCELDAIDRTRDAFLCANTGEGDFAWSDGASACRVFATGADSGRRACGCSISQTLRPGPATMIGFSPRSGAPGGFVLIAMEGETLEKPNVRLSVTSAWFRARRAPMRRAFEAWGEAGATHHGSLSPGHLGARLSLVARMLGIGFEQI